MKTFEPTVFLYFIFPFTLSRHSFFILLDLPIVTRMW